MVLQEKAKWLNLTNLLGREEDILDIPTERNFWNCSGFNTAEVWCQEERGWSPLALPSPEHPRPPPLALQQTLRQVTSFSHIQDVDVFLYLIRYFVQEKGSHCDPDSSALASNVLAGGDISAPVQLIVATPTMLGYDVPGGGSDILLHQKHLALFHLCTG